MTLSSLAPVPPQSASKAPVNLILSTEPTFGNALSIGVDEIFLLASKNIRGTTVAVDTDDSFHTYRIEVSTAGAIDVYYDDVLTLGGSSFSSASANGSVPRVGWGLDSTFAQGTAEWEFVSHNAGTATVPELGVSAAVVLGFCFLALGVAVLERRRKPLAG